jgi:hypothetical protein
MAFHSGNLQRLLTFVAAQALLCSAFAQNGAPSDVMTVRPAESIQSLERAEQALVEAARQRAAIEGQYAMDQRECYPRFFTTSCLDEAKERRRVALGQVRAVEVEANTYKRRATVLERDKALAERRAAEEAEAPQRMKAQADADARTEARAAAKAKEEKSTDASDDRIKSAVDLAEKREAKRKREKAANQINAKKRAENIAAHDRKVKDAAEHQRAITDRKVAKQREREAQVTGKESAGSPAASK